MKLEELNSMKYGDLLKLAKEKCNVTRRISKVGITCNLLVNSVCLFFVPVLH